MGVAAVAGLLAALIGLLWIIRAKHLRLRFNRRARGLRYFRVVSTTGAAGTRLESARGDRLESTDGAAPAPGRDDAVGR
jgi:hypothetical protein